MLAPFLHSVRDRLLLCDGDGLDPSRDESSE